MLDIKKLFTKILNAIKDTGWTAFPYTSAFTNYSTADPVANPLRYRKIGKMVEINGIMKPTAAITGSATQVEIGTLPAGYRPTSQIDMLCQGSTTGFWLFIIGTTGRCTFSRYRMGDTYADTTDSTWLPIHVTFMID